MPIKKLTVIALLSITTSFAQWQHVDPPAQPQSGMPFLTSSANKALYLSWIDPIGKEHALRFARWTGSAWTAPETIARGASWFVNWADFPALQVLSDGSMLAHWLVRPTGGGKYGYGIRIARRPPGPPSNWVEVEAINENDAEDYAGFLSFGGSFAAYLSPPANRQSVGLNSHKTAEEDHIKTLRFARFGPDGRITADSELDGDVCSCCQTAMARTSSGLVVAYRDHLPGEIRDISVVRNRNGKWTAPVVLHRDGWKINGCPTEGPSIAASRKTVGVAWITRANEVSRLQVALSSDDGDTFSSPIRGDDGNPLGRPNLAPVDEKQMLMVWLERTAGGAEVRLRRIFSDGSSAKAVTVARVEASRASGLPKVAVHGDKVFVAWPSEQVRAAWLPLSAIPSRLEQ